MARDEFPRIVHSDGSCVKALNYRRLRAPTPIRFDSFRASVAAH